MNNLLLSESIFKAIRTILLTSKGEVPLRPNFGLGAETLLGGSLSNMDLAYKVIEQLSLYEPRIKVDKVVSVSDGAGEIKATIFYKIIETNTNQIIIL